MPPAEQPLTLLYRGSLSSCNYDCSYCPFAKRKDSRATLAKDAASLQRFVGWVKTHAEYQIDLLFTPWGEALPRHDYQQALVTLSQLPHIRRVSIQTNLSAIPSRLSQANPQKIGLWCSFHPDQTRLDSFLQRIGRLQQLGVHHSVGMVGKREHFAWLQQLRQRLPASTYLWVNAYWDEGRNYYRDDEIAWLTQLDPWFHYNLTPGNSLHAPCRAGSSALSIDADGNVRRCHFVDQILGNLYDGWQAEHSPCPNGVCDCYIGYMLRKDRAVAEQFGAGVLTRLPLNFG